jgi:hypothetical protein
VQMTVSSRNHRLTRRVANHHGGPLDRGPGSLSSPLGRPAHPVAPRIQPTANATGEKKHPKRAAPEPWISRPSMPHAT